MLHFEFVLCGLPFRLALVPHSLRTYSTSLLAQFYQERDDHYSASLLGLPCRIAICAGPLACLSQKKVVD